MKHCDCREWKVSEPILACMVQLATIHGATYDGGMPFMYCPWCAKKLVDPNGPPHELRPLLIEAVKALDMGVAIEPSSYVHEELKRLLGLQDTSTGDLPK